MKVLFVNTLYAGGGAARAARRIMGSVADRGVDCQMLVKVIDAPRVQPGERVHSIDEFKPRGRWYARLDLAATKLKNKWQHFQWRDYGKMNGEYYLSDLRSTRIFGALRKLPYDILHLHWVNGRFLDIDQLRKVGKPIVWTLHDSWAFCGVCHYFLDCQKYKTHCGSCPMLWKDPSRAKERDLAYRLFDHKMKAFAGLDLHIVTPSRWLGQSAKASPVLRQFSVDVIPNSIDAEKFSPRDRTASFARWDIQPKADKRYILYGAMSATTDKIKGFAQLLTALKDYQARYEYGQLELIVFGVTDRIPSLELDFPVKYLGVVRDDDGMAMLYSLADVMVVPSLTENLSNVIMESLSCGTPVVAFDIGGNSDMIDHQQNGYLAHDEAQMADGIAWCLANNHDRHLSRNARQKVLDNFTPDRVGRLYAELYNRLVK